MKLLQGLLLVTCAFLLLECSARGLLTLRNDIRWEMATWAMFSDNMGRGKWYRYSGELGWEKRPGFSGVLEEQEIFFERNKLRKQFDSQGFSVVDSAQVVDSRLPKIITIGDSSTLGYGVPPDRTYAEQLDRMLPDIDVVNLGVSGYTSWQGLRVLEKYLPVLNPSLVIISFNFNDRRYVLSPDDIDSAKKFRKDMSGRRFMALHERVYLYQLLRGVMARVGIIDNEDHVRGETVNDLRALSARVPPDKYRENLTEMVSLAKTHKVPVIFLNLTDNPFHTQYLNRGLDFFKKGQHDLAVRELMIGARTINWHSELARKYLAKVYEERNELDNVQKVVRINPKVSSHGGLPLYRDSEYNEIMRSVGNEYGVTVVEVGQVLDGDMYLDHCHPDERGHKMIADLLYVAVKDIVSKS